MVGGSWGLCGFEIGQWLIELEEARVFSPRSDTDSLSLSLSQPRSMASTSLKPPSPAWGVVIGFVGLLGFCCDLDLVDGCCGSPTWGVGGFQRGVVWGLVVVWVTKNRRVFKF